MRLALTEWLSTKEKANTPILRPEIRKQIISKLQETKNHLSSLGDDVHSNDNAMPLGNPEVLTGWDNSSPRADQSYAFSYAGLDIRFPHPKLPKDQRETSAQMDFTPFLLRDYSPKQAALAIASFYLSIDEFNQHTAKETSSDGSKLRKPYLISGETNSVMKSFLVDALGFEVIQELESEVSESGKKYIVQGNYSNAIERLRKIVEEEDFEKLFRIMDKTDLGFFIKKLQPARV